MAERTMEVPGDDAANNSACSLGHGGYHSGRFMPCPWSVPTERTLSLSLTLQLGSTRRILRITLFHGLRTFAVLASKRRR